MGKKKHPEHVNHERWLVSYADFITLLFAFFVVLFASGQSDKHKKHKMAEAVQAAFSQMGIFDQHSKRPSIDNTAGPNGMPMPLSMPLPSTDPAEADTQKQIEKIVKQQAAQGGLKADDVSIRHTDEGLVISLHEGGFFDSGSADVRAESLPTLKALAGSVPPAGIRVEGHTDNVPMHSAAFASNWELSSARASAIARYLLEHGTANPQQMSVAGYAEFHPVASNATPEGRAQNRRVDVVLLKPKDPESKAAEAKAPEAKPASPQLPPVARLIEPTLGPTLKPTASR